MKVLIPSALRSYTGQRNEVQAEGDTLDALVDDLERRFAGIRFRMVDEQDHMRAHVRFFVNGVQTFELSQPLRAGDEVVIVQALSGG